VIEGRVVGDVTDLSVVEEQINAAGRTVRRVRHETGRLITYTLDEDGQVTNVRLLAD
jgi:hypothetical protein